MDDKEYSLQKELVELVKNAVEFRKGNRDKEYLNNMAHYEGLQWELAENKDESPFFCKSDINHLKNAVDIRLGSLFSESYYGELQPLSPNDVDNIEKLNVLYRDEWKRLNADMHVETAIKNGCLQDNGYVEIDFDESKIFGWTGALREGAIVLRDLATSDVYLDPSATSIDDCDYYVVKLKKTKDWLKRNKPEWLEKIKENNLDATILSEGEEGNLYKGRDYGKSQNSIYVIDAVHRKYAEEREIEVLDEEGNPIIDTEKSKFDKKGNLVEPVILTEKVPVTRIKIHYKVGDKLLETHESYPFDEFSIIQFQWEPIPQSPYGIPLLRGLTIPQKVANLIESAANNVAMHYSTPTWIVSEESGLDINKVAKLANALGMVWKVSGPVNEAIKQMDFPDVNEQLIAIKESFVQNIKNYAGTSDTYIGNIGTAGSTAEGTNMAVNRATVIDNSPTSQIQKFVEKLSRMKIKYMTRYYKGHTVYIRDTAKTNGKYQFQDFTIEAIYENLSFDFDVKLASRSKSDKNRQYNLLKDIYQLQNQYKDPKKVINVPDLVKAAQLDNYDDMFKRFSDMSEEAFMEKADMIVQIMNIGGTITPNGQPLVTSDEMQQAIIDVLDDNGDLTLVENMFKMYEEYQVQIANLKNQIEMKRRQNVINTANAQNQALRQQMEGAVANMTQNSNVDNVLSQIGL